jgi:serine/threonine protein kinase
VAGISGSLKFGAAIDKILDSSDDSDDDMVFIDDNAEDYLEAAKTPLSPAALPKTSPAVAGLPRSVRSAEEPLMMCAVPNVMAQKPLQSSASYTEPPRSKLDHKQLYQSSSEDGDEEEDEEKAGSDSGSDYSDDEDEGEGGYKPGGYHAVKVGEVYNQRYVVIKKLGWGHFSTVWMVKDRKVIAQQTVNQFFALKVQKSAEHYTEAAMDEVELLDCVASERKQCEASQVLDSTDPDGVTATEIVEHSKHVATLHDSFFHTGPNGRHMCMVFTMLGCNLLSVIKAFNYRGIPVPVVKRMVRGICMGLDFLHRKCSIIHTDLKPENVLLQFPNQMTPAELEYITRFSGGGDIKTPDRHTNPLAVSTVELEAALKDPNLPADERNRIMNRLHRKKLRQSESRDADDGLLTDMDLDAMLSDPRVMASEAVVSPDSQGRFQRYQPHSAFVLCNFGEQQIVPDAKLHRVLKTNVKISNPSGSDLDSYLRNQEDKSGGLARICFLLRAYTPEEELADNVSVALGNIPWDRSKEKYTTREWYVYCNTLLKS